MLDRLTILRERLLRDGIAPGRVHRYVNELRDHLEDVQDELRASGLSGPQARAAAWRRLGSYDALALPILVDASNRSWASRYPWLVYLVAPASACALACGVLLLALITAARIQPLLPVMADLGAIASILWLAVSLVMAWAVQALGLLHRAKPTWPVIGAAAMALLGAMVQLEVTVPAAQRAGAISLTLSQPAWLLSFAMLGLALLPALSLRLVR